ncbi:hypothetical protein ACS0TY_007819 [Phlomoides rotata]
MNFIFVLSGWEGYVPGIRILRDAVTRPNGLRVPNGIIQVEDGDRDNLIVGQRITGEDQPGKLRCDHNLLPDYSDHAGDRLISGQEEMTFED